MTSLMLPMGNSFEKQFRQEFWKVDHMEWDSKNSFGPTPVATVLIKSNCSERPEAASVADASAPVVVV